jgi:hypothetical protein
MKSYNNYLLDCLKNSLLLLVEGYVYGSDSLLDRLRNMRSVFSDASVIKILDNLLDIFEDDLEFEDSKISQNYFDLVDSAEDKVSFIQNTRVKDYSYERDLSNPKQVWTMPGRSEIKIGRVVRQLLSLKGVEVSDREIELFVNTFKATKSNDELEFKLVSGDDIHDYYQEDSYFNLEGSLGNSCMSDVSKKVLKIYTENPKKVKMLVLLDSNGKIHGRALVWKLKKSPSDSKFFMDKAYVNKDSHYVKYKAFANSNDWMTRLNSTAGLNDNWKFSYKDKVYYGEITVKLDGNFREYPYLDTLSFLNKDKDKLSNLPDKKCYLLDDTEGEIFRCYNCEGELIFGDELCDVCCLGHSGLSELDIETKWNTKAG